MVKSLLADPKAQMGKKKGENTISADITSPGFWNTLSSIEQII
jgi:hypothetical protein